MACDGRSAYVTRMASIATFNTLDVMRRLKSSGFTEQQAEGIADTLSKDAMADVATRRDLNDLEARVETRFVKMENTLTIRMGAIAAATATIILAGVKFIH